MQKQNTVDAVVTKSVTKSVTVMKSEQTNGQRCRWRNRASLLQQGLIFILPSYAPKEKNRGSAGFGSETPSIPVGG